MYKSELIDTLSRCDKVFNTLKHIPEFIEIHIILCDSKEELYRKRCELTTHPLAKQKLLIDREDYITAAGCYIIPPKENVFTILLLQTGNIFCDSYNYVHELTHICNYVDFLSTTNYSNIFGPFENHDLFLWDEYNARYISTCVMCEMLSPISNFDDLSHCIKIVCDVLRKCVDEENIVSYDGSQLLGAIQAAYEKGIISSYSDYLSSVEIAELERKSVLDITNFIK